MTQENGGMQKKDTKAIWIMLALLLVLTGLVVTPSNNRAVFKTKVVF